MNAGGWVKSSFSFANGNCVELRLSEGGIDVRDSRDRNGPVLHFGRRTWRRFLRQAQGRRLG
jgi:hypothetical protein